MGCIYKRGETFWIKYYRNGKPYQESSKSKKETDAKRLLKQREGQISEGRFPGLKAEKIRFEELAEDLLNDYRMNGRKSLERVEISLNHLKNIFSGYRVADMTTSQIQSYMVKRQGKGQAMAL